MGSAAEQQKGAKAARSGVAAKAAKAATPSRIPSSDQDGFRGDQKTLAGSYQLGKVRIHEVNTANFSVYFTQLEAHA